MHRNHFMQFLRGIKTLPNNVALPRFPVTPVVWARTCVLIVPSVGTKGLVVAIAIGVIVRVNC